MQQLITSLFLIKAKLHNCLLTLDYRLTHTVISIRNVTGNNKLLHRIIIHIAYIQTNKLHGLQNGILFLLNSIFLSGKCQAASILFLHTVRFHGQY